ncbi:hypothetical protein DL96DRAFT_1667339 [Flagelloscypha sp. PMI_526]|nr:hypothetical protein DL96DRAFT_1667339 [Flagelloscypha sp. PMI_526]
MPHKRAKKSVRDALKKDQGIDLVPTSGQSSALSNEPIPKSVSRVLNAVKIRKDFHDRKRKMSSEDTGERPSKKRKPAVGIMEGESMQHFNKRVEMDMRPSMSSAIQTAKTLTRKAIREDKQARNIDRKKPSAKPAAEFDSESPKRQVRATEFQTMSTSTPKRLNDIAQAPPEFTKFPRKASTKQTTSKKDNIVSMAQKVMMEQEREKAIARYRELKAQKEMEKDKDREKAKP